MSDRGATRMPSDAVSDKFKPPALSDMLNDGDIVLLLTPAINYPPSDPFEPLGKALARYHPPVRHVPYVPRHGITSTHETHVALAVAVIFVISGPLRHGQPSQVTLAERVRALCEGRPQGAESPSFTLGGRCSSYCQMTDFDAVLDSVDAALTYGTESPVAKDLPWASSIADDIGGVTCLCISDDVPRNSVIIRLLDTCIHDLKDVETNKVVHRWR
ncbi:hypothetical protein VTK26DRAFT_657 [Humicola hyalothermophila]